MADQHNESLKGCASLIRQMMTMNLPENVDYMVDEDQEMGGYDDPDG